MEKVRKLVAFILMLILLTAAWASSYHIVVHIWQGEYMIAVDSIDSITFCKPRSMFVHLKDSSVIDFNNVDSVTICEAVSDTIYIMYCGKRAFISNPHADKAYISLNDSNADVFLKIKEKYSTPIISINGNTTDGRLCIDSEVDYTLVLNGVNITSSHAPAINSISKHKATLILEEGTDNVLSDANLYVFSDSSETSSGCLNTLGALAIAGKGRLSVFGNMKHALHAKKSISIKDGTLAIPYAVSDAIHSDKNVNIEGGNLQLLGMQGDGIDLDDDFTMTEGCIEMNIEGESAKGIKCGKLMNIEGGTITATASGALKNKKGDLAYCTIMKCDSSMTIAGGDFHLVNNSPGGKCISVAHNLEISGGSFYLETSGDGAKYINVEGDTDYYTSKCISVGDTLLILHCSLECLSTGNGGKGIDCGKELTIGRFLSQDHELIKINVTTTGTSIVNDVEEDKRFGCPKAFKSDDQLDILSGTIHVTTKGMGGEGFESKNEIWIVDGNITCDTFDDCFNAGTQIYVYGGNIYCCSQDNDGFDSNGRIVIEGGNIFSTSLHSKNESFDTEGNTLLIKGGNIIGIGGGKVVPEQSSIPFYSYTFWDDQIVQQSMPIISLTRGNYLTVMQDDRYLMSGYIPADFTKSIITVASPLLNSHQQYTVVETGVPESGASCYKGLFYINGSLSNVIEEKFSFVPSYYSHQK